MGATWGASGTLMLLAGCGRSRRIVGGQCGAGQFYATTGEGQALRGTYSEVTSSKERLWAGCALQHVAGTWRQGKHGFAAHMRGACYRRCCGESPRALGQRVPLEDQTALARPAAAMPCAEPRGGLALAACSNTDMP